MRYPAIGSDIDATACYDRQLRNAIGLCTRHLGAPKEAALCQIQTLKAMKHKVKTAIGTSDREIFHTQNTPMYGSGQGSGAGGTNWHSHNEVIIKAYTKFHPPFKMYGPDTSKQIDQAGVSFVDDNTLLHLFLPIIALPLMLLKCKNAIETWQVFMTITGGCLALEKCHNSVISHNFNTFKYSKRSKYMGLPRLHTATEISGTCMVQSADGTTSTEIKTLDPSKGHRLLGVRLAADGNCTDEYKFRKRQSRLMAGRLDNSNATPQDAFMIYQFRYCPAVMYCAPITYFNKKQCDDIQKPFINVLLPKIKLNRHTKRAIIWGPRRYGGLQLKDMYAEQLVRTVDKMLAHIRDATAVGVTMQVTIDSYQALIGSATPFFELNPESVPYRPDSRTTKITFVWESLFALGASLKVAQQWLPTLKFKNDIAIMDAILATQKTAAGTSTFISNQRIVFANACRLWLRVQVLSNIVDHTGRHIMDWAMYGTNQRTVEGRYPHQEKPPPHVWKEWRIAIRQCFLCRPTNNAQCHQLLNPLNEAMPPITEFTWLPKAHLRGAPLKYIFSTLPHLWQTLLAPSHWPTDEGNSIVASLRASQVVNSYLDGSVADGLGAHAYTVRPRCEQPELAIEGTAMSPGDPDTISSLRPEHYGGLCVAIWFWILEQRFGPIPNGQFECHIDNDTVVKRVTKGRPGNGAAASTLVTDYDLWCETVNVLENVACRGKFIHVKGHQDDFIVLEKKQGPLNQHAFWNVQMDRLASATRTANETTPVTPFLTSSKIALMVNGSAVTTNISRVLKDQLVAAPMESYICEREGWTQSTFCLVDWKAMDRALKSLSIHKRVNAAKYMFDWQNTGEQKQRFEDSLARSEDRNSTQVNLCPLNCGSHETAQHFLKCTVLRNAHIIDQCFTSLHRWFTKNKTHPILQKLLMTAITAWMDDTELPDDIEAPAYMQEWGIFEALDEQSRIGWNNFMKGRITQKFGTIQMMAVKMDDKIENIPPHYSAT